MNLHRWPAIKRSAIHTHCDNSNTLIRTILRKGPCDGPGEFAAELSLGDIAHFAGADLALRCSHSFDWKNIDLRRSCIGIIVLCIQRAYPNMDDLAVMRDIAALDGWSKGEVTPDLTDRGDALSKAVTAMSPEPPHTSDEIAIMQIWMLMQVALENKIAVCRWTNYGAASVAIVGSQLISDARNDLEETARQIQDIVERFPRT